MVEIDFAKLKNNFEVVATRLREHPDSGMVTASAETRLIRNLQMEAVVKDVSATHTLRGDEDVVRGGENTAPSPLSHLLAGFGFCQLVWYAKCAALMGIAFESLEVKATFQFDMRGEQHIDNVYSGVQKFILETSITSGASEERVRALAKLADESCPIFSTLRKSASILQKITLNGVVISDNTQ